MTWGTACFDRAVPRLLDRSFMLITPPDPGSTEFVNDQVGAIKDLYNLLATGDRVERVKPSPDLYLHATAELGVDSVVCGRWELRNRVYIKGEYRTPGRNSQFVFPSRGAMAGRPTSWPTPQSLAPRTSSAWLPSPAGHSMMYTPSSWNSSGKGGMDSTFR